MTRIQKTHASLRRDWDELADCDPLWAVNSLPERKFGRWDEESFFETGRFSVDGIFREAAEVGLPAGWERALDFGCGAGRLSRHLAGRFDTVEAVDISEGMILTARELNREVRNVHFLVNQDPDLRMFDRHTFDAVVSLVVLQHLPGTDAVAQYLREFVRVLRPGGLIAFQMPHRLNRVRRALQRRLPYLALRRAGFSHRLLYFRLGLHPMQMCYLPSDRVEQILSDAGATMSRCVDLGTDDRLYLATVE